MGLSKIEGLTKNYGTSAADVSLTMEPGSFVGVIGRSGAGKSTRGPCSRDRARRCGRRE